jgi:hypothetical protein
LSTVPIDGSRVSEHAEAHAAKPTTKGTEFLAC